MRFKHANRIANYLDRRTNLFPLVTESSSMGKAVTTEVAKTSLAAVLSRNLTWECNNAKPKIETTGGAVFSAMEKKGITGASVDAIDKHLAGTQEFATKTPKRSILNAYAQLFGYLATDSILKNDHIRRRQAQLTGKTTALTEHVAFAKTASVDDAHAALDRLWGTPHQSLAAYLLKYLDSD